LTFYVGIHQPGDAHYFANAFISVNRIRGRKKPLNCKNWIMDSGAFTELATYGYYRHSPHEYARTINQWSKDMNLRAAVTQDYMCEAFILAKAKLADRGLVSPKYGNGFHLTDEGRKMAARMGLLSWECV